MATKQPFGQARNQQGRDWGNFNALTDCPNASGWVGAPTSGLEEGDTAYVVGLGRVYCSSAGTPGSLTAVWAQTGGGSSSPVLYTLDTTTTAEIDTPAFFRTISNLPASPTGTVTPSVVASVSQPGRSAIRISGTINGGWVAPLITGITLPAEGYVVDVEIDGISGWIGGFCPLLRIDSPGGFPTPYGIYAGQRSFAANVFTSMLRMQTTVYTRSEALTVQFGSTAATPSSTNLLRGPFRYICEVRRQDGQIPARWAMRLLALSDGNVVSSITSQAVCPTLTGLDGLSFDRVGIFVDLESDSGTAPCSVDITKFQIRRLDTGLL